MTAVTVHRRHSPGKHGQAVAGPAHPPPDEGLGGGDGVPGETQTAPPQRYFLSYRSQWSSSASGERRLQASPSTSSGLRPQQRPAAGGRSVVCLQETQSGRFVLCEVTSHHQYITRVYCQVLRRFPCSSASTGWTPSVIPPTSPSTLPPQRWVSNNIS